MKKPLGLLLLLAAVAAAGSSCASAPAADPVAATSTTRGTVPPDLTAGAPSGAIKVDLPVGPVWVDGVNVYSEGCKAKALTDASVTELLKAKNTSPPSPNKTFSLICKPGTG